MPATVASLRITWSVTHTENQSQLVLSERLDGHDTFLTGVLELDQRQITVRIITLDDVTVLRPTDPDAFKGMTSTQAGVLHLPHGARRRRVPPDLAAAAAKHQRALDYFDDAELRYALTFLEEATTTDIRRARIAAIVAALPAMREQSAEGSDDVSSSIAEGSDAD
ncbi:MAG: hypothetical protein ACRDYX_08345 [Egibacteraceae bacterium]